MRRNTHPLTLNCCRLRICLHVLSIYSSRFGYCYCCALSWPATSEGNIHSELDQFGQGSNLLQFDLNEVYEKGPWRANCSKDLCKPECGNPNAKEYKIQACNVSLVKGFRKKGIWTNPQVLRNTAGSFFTYESKTTNQDFSVRLQPGPEHLSNLKMVVFHHWKNGAT